MNWKTVYIFGNGNFAEEVNDRLLKAPIFVMTGNVEERAGGQFEGLYWLENSSNLRRFKMAIGPKMIFKYRLRFKLETELTEEPHKTIRLTDREHSLLEKFRLKTWKRATA